MALFNNYSSDTYSLHGEEIEAIVFRPAVGQHLFLKNAQAGNKAARS